jgi:23S rRNA pseudouridine1911/1915/1917 synthase
MVVARSLQAHTHLVAQLQERSVKREYLALVQGEVIAGGTVDAPIGRHPVDRKRMAVVPSGKPAISHYRVEERFNGYTLLRVSLETGRTHQIRVHMAHIRYPIVGDPVYGGRLRIPPGLPDEMRSVLQSFRRQALHATQLGLVHPDSGDHMSWQALPPEDMQQLIEVLRQWSA